MADNGSGDDAPQAAPQGQQGQQGQAPMIAVAGQYVKDLSFEVPGAPQVFEKLREKAPEINLNLDVSAKKLQEDLYEIGLKINIDAKLGEESAFVLELLYGGVFKVNVPPEHLEPVLLIECPRILFPFARNIVCDATRDGGFVPLMLQPVDFAALYRDRLAQKQAEQAAKATKN